jgi:chromosome segregation ATPase
MQEWQEKIEQEVGQLREEVRLLREQRAEPITIPRIELDPGGIQARLDNQAELLKEISQKQDTFSTDVDELKLDAKAYVGDAAIFKNKVEHMEDDVSTLKTDMEQVKTDIGTVKTRLDGHAKFFEEHGKRLAATATKDDIKNMATKDDIAGIKATQEQILKLLQQKPPES